MHARQYHKLAAYIATEAALKDASVIHTIPALAAPVALFRAKVAEIHELAQAQVHPTMGRTARSHELLAEMMERAQDVAAAVAVLARHRHLTEPAALVDIRPRAFARTRKGSRPVLAQIIADAAESVAAELVPYGVTAETLAALQASIAAAWAGLHQPRMTIVEKCTATSRLAELFAEIDALLTGEIDRLVFRLRQADLEFYLAYHFSRAVEQRRGGPRKEVEASLGGAQVEAAPLAAGTLAA